MQTMNMNFKLNSHIAVFQCCIGGIVPIWAKDWLKWIIVLK